MWGAAILAGGRARRLGGPDKSALIVDGVAVIDRQLACFGDVLGTSCSSAFVALALRRARWSTT